MGGDAVIALAQHGEKIRDDQQRGRGCEQKPADHRAGERGVLLLAGAADRHRQHADDHGGCRHQHRADAGAAREDRGVVCLHAEIMAAAVISTGRMRVRPARIAASYAFMPASCCSRAKVTSRIEFAEATPMAMIAPISEGTLNVVPVIYSIVTMPQN